MKKAILILGLALFLKGFSQTQDEGIRQIEFEQYNKAKNIFKTLIQKEPANARNFFYLGESYFISEQLDSAEYFYKKGIEANSKEAYNYIGTGKVLLQKENEETAQEQFRKGISATGKDVIFYSLLGEAWSICKKNNFDNAKKYFDKAIDINEKNPDVYIKTGDMILVKTKNGGDAIGEYNKAIYYDKNSAKAYYKKGLVYLRGKIVQQAVEAFTTAISIDSNFLPAYRELGEIYLLAKKYEKAVEAYTKYISLADYNIKDRIRYAAMLFYNKNYAASNKILTELYTKEPKNANILRLLAYMSYELNEPAKGMEYINSFFKLVEPTKILSSDYEYFANLLAKTGNDSLAIENYKTTILLDSSKTNLFENIAKIYEKNKKYKNASDAYEKFILSSKEPMASTYYLYGKSIYNMIANDSLLQDTTTINFYLIKADSAFSKFSQLSVNPHIGYLFRAHLYSMIDKPIDPKNSFSVKGLGKPLYENVINLLENKNLPKFNKDLIEAYNYLKFYYYAQYEKELKTNKNSALQNLDTSISFAEKVVSIDPKDINATKGLENLKKLRLK